MLRIKYRHFVLHYGNLKKTWNRGSKRPCNYQRVKDDESDTIIEKWFSEYESGQRLFHIQILENGQNCDLKKIASSNEMKSRT